MKGRSYSNHDVFYTMFKKHTCPQCGVRVKRVTVSRVVNSKSPEASKYDFSLGDSFLVGDVEMRWVEFQCPQCLQNYTITDMKQIEKKARKK